MTTTVNFDLSATLQQTLTADTGTYAYAIAFGASTPGGTVDLVTSATLINGGALDQSSITLPSPNFYSGAIYVLIQQGGDGTLLSSITDITDITPANAVTNNYSYQLFEATLSGSGEDLGDISAVNTFGFTSTYQVAFQDGSTDQRGFNTSGANIFATFPTDAVTDFQNNGFPNSGMLASGPATADNASPWLAADWQAYVNNLKNNKAVLDDINIVAGFTGGTSLQQNPMLSQYSVEYVKSDKYGTDYFWLKPDTSNGATNTDWIRITADQLMQNIYIQPGPLEVHLGGRDGTVVYYDSFTPNNAVGQIAQYFVAGFDAGFWGGSGTSPNSLVTQSIDFNQTWNWTIDYAYNATLNPGAVTYTNTLGTGPGTAGGNDRFYDPWAQQFLVNTNAYGYSYSDLVSAGGVNPQITLWDPGLGANVQTINITLYDNSETPASGYQASNPIYVAPASSTYESALTATTNQIGFSFNFSLGSLNFTPDENTPIQFRFYAPDSTDADASGFVTLSVSGTNGDWYYYSLAEDSSGDWSLSAGNATGLNGFFNIQNLPTTSDGSVSWYQLVFGDPTAQTIYNIYATTDPSTQNFTSIVADHGVEVIENSSSNYTLSFAPGGAVTYDIATFGPPAASPTAAGAFIDGSKKNDLVNALDTVRYEGLPTSGADIIQGNRGDDYLSGLDGNDTIDGGKGVDYLYGGAGDDILLVKEKQGKNDYFDGGSGVDTLKFVGKDIVTLAGFNAASSSIEVLEGNGRALHGTDDMDVFDFSGLTAMTGVGTIKAKGGNDILIGSNFAEEMQGGDGDDILDGRGGNDILDGGSGHNTYVFADGYGNDTVVEFRPGNDTFDFTGVAGVSSFADLTLTQIDRKTVLIDFDGIAGGDTLTIHKTTIAELTANQNDFLFS